MNDRKEVIKHSAAVHIQNNITLLQRRAWNVLLANAYDSLPSQEEYDMALRELGQTLEFDSKNENYLKEALKALTTCGVEWNILDKDNQEEWGATTLLAHVSIKGGLCTYSYSPPLRRRLYNPRMYARLNLSMQNKFDSKHAQALWELCLDYLDEARHHGETPFVALARYRKLMGLTDGQYPRFKDLSHYVIKSPVAEINRVTDFRVEVVYQRTRRKVTAVKFKVRCELPLPGHDSRQGALFPELDDMPPLVEALKAAGLASADAWHIWQQGTDVVESADKPTPEAFNAYIREKIDLLQRRQRAGKVVSATGFLLSAIKHNYPNPEHRFAWQSYREHGSLQAPSVAGVFMAMLESELLTEPEERSLEAFAAWVGEA